VHAHTYAACSLATDWPVAAVAAVAVAGATATRRASREARRRRSRSQREGEDQSTGDIDLFNFIGTEEARGNVLAASESESLDRASEC